MNIREIFSREIERDIKEVIKVDDRQSVLEEVEEYIPTDHIVEELIDCLERFQETINNPSEEINIWVSGFFGSGKSSFAKILGYLLANPEFEGTTVAERFFELNEVPQAKALLNTIHSAAPTETVLLDLNTSPNVLQEGEPIVLPIYRTLLHELGYSGDVVLAELEFELEGEGTLEAFEKKYAEIFDTSWESQRDVITAKNRASRVLYELDERTYPAADSWSNAAEPPAITAKWFAKRSLELLRRRRPDKERILFVVDEVGQYVSRSTDRMRHLQGLAEEFQKTKGKLWLVATSQEKLTDVVDSLEGKQTELAKAQDRFPIRVDLLPSDIDDVTGKRVLEKTAAGASEVRQHLDADRNKLATSVLLQSDRHGAFADEDFVRLYPLVPYQLQVLIDAVSARRAQGGAPQTMGGSNRTLIRHAQQLISNPSVGLADQPVGALVTLDRSYLLLEDVIPTAWRHEVDQVASKHGDDSLEAKIMRVIALCSEVPGVPLSARNLAVALHPSMSSDPIEAEVENALADLVAEDRVLDRDGGYQLQSPEQKDWEKTRRGIDMKPGDAVRLRKQILRDAIGSLTVTEGRTFKIELIAEGEKMSDGDITLDIRHDADLERLRQTSRGEDAKSKVFWAFQTDDDTWEALAEVHRSIEMIERYDTPSQTDEQRPLIAEERKRRDRAFKKAEQLLARDVTAGTTIFDGNTDDPPAGALASSASQVVSDLLGKIYPELALFAGTYKKADVLKVLQADDLDGLPDSFGPDGLGLFRISAGGRELVTDAGPIDVVTSYIENRKQFGEDQNGAQLERYFGRPPYGAPVEALQAVLAAALRAGMIEVVSQAARITSASDRRLEQVFGNLNKFRAASFSPSEGSEISKEIRGEVSDWLHEITGEPTSLDLHEIAEASRATFASMRQPCTEAKSALRGANLTVPEVLVTMDELLARVTSADDELVVTTIHERRSDLEVGRSEVPQIAELVENELRTLRSALAALETASGLANPEASKWADDLEELLNRAQYAPDLAQIRSLTSKLEDAKRDEEDDVRSTILSEVEDRIEVLRSRYPGVGDEEFAAATKPIQSLVEADQLPVLRANAHAIDGVVESVAEELDALSTTKQVRHIRVSDVWSAPITSAEELESALARLREAVLAQLGDDTEVRFR